MSLLGQNGCQFPAPAKLKHYQHFVIAAVAFLFLSQFAILLSGIPVALAGDADFRALYAAGFMVRSGNAHHLYNYDLQERVQNTIVAPRNGALPFIYPAYASLLFLPLSFLSYRSAYFVFFAVNLLLLWLSAKLIRSNLEHLTELWQLLPLAQLVCFFPAGVALLQGQTSILLLALYSGSFAALQKGNHVRAGMFLGVAVFKFQIALPIAILFLIWRRWRFVGGFLAGTTAAMVVSLCLVGTGGFVQYWRSLFLMATSISERAAQLKYGMFPAMMPNMNGLFHLVAGDVAWVKVIAPVASGLLFAWMATAKSRSLPMAIVCALIISRHLGLHDLVLLYLPVALALDNVAARPLELGTRITSISCAVLLFPPVYLVLMERKLVPWLAVAMLAFLFCIRWNGQAVPVKPVKKTSLAVAS